MSSRCRTFSASSVGASTRKGTWWGYSARPEFGRASPNGSSLGASRCRQFGATRLEPFGERSEEHTSELQSLTNLVCRPLHEKKTSGYTPSLSTSQAGVGGGVSKIYNITAHERFPR